MRSVVVTGASSGIGRAAARAFAVRRARVVLAARSTRLLEDVADECRAAGGEPLVVPTDVTVPEHVEALCSRAVDRFGGFDVWVNDAGVMAIGHLERTPLEVVQRVLSTNLLGTVYGSRAALSHFRSRGRGVLVNVSSVLGATAAPRVSAYAASKFGIQGLSEALRQEVSDAPGIHVVDVQPATIVTALYDHVANYTGRAVRPVPPTFSAEDVARAIVRAADRPRRTVTVGWSGYGLRWGHALAPRLLERLLPRLIGVAFRDEPAEPTSGNVLRPSEDVVEASGDRDRSRA